MLTFYPMYCTYVCTYYSVGQCVSMHVTACLYALPLLLQAVSDHTCNAFVKCKHPRAVLRPVSNGNQCSNDCNMDWVCYDSREFCCGFLGLKVRTSCDAESAIRCHMFELVTSCPAIRRRDIIYTCQFPFAFPNDQVKLSNTRCKHH